MKRVYFIMPGREQLGLILFFAVLLLSQVLCGPALAGEVVPPAILKSFESFSKNWMRGFMINF